MHAVKTLLLLCLANLIIANATTDVLRRAQLRPVAVCDDLTSSTTNDGFTVTSSRFPDPSCWDTLGMTDWMKTWNATTVVCTAAQSHLAACQCRIDEPWATCFMRLTYATNKTAKYGCTDVTTPDNCTAPTPRNIVPGPAEIFYGAFSVQSETLVIQIAHLTSRSLASFNYLAVWYKVLTASTSMPAITNELSKSKTVNDLLVALVRDFATEENTSQALTSILTASPISNDDISQQRPTLSNAPALLGQLLQQVLDYIMSDWAGGYFLAMAEGGMLLNGPVETTRFLTPRLEEQKKRVRM